jgi:hypothetical protein
LFCGRHDSRRLVICKEEFRGDLHKAIGQFEYDIGGSSIGYGFGRNIQTLLLKISADRIIDDGLMNDDISGFPSVNIEILFMW